MDPSVRTAGTFLNEDQRWLGNGGKPIGSPRDIVLDRSAFDLVTAFPNGFIPSGIGLARVTATGLYIPYVNQTNEVAVITRTATGGTVTFTMDGETTAATAVVAATTAAQIKTALETLGNINVGDITVTGAAGGPFTVTFVAGDYAGIDAPNLTVDATNATGGTVTIANTAGGVESPVGEATGKGLLFASIPYDRDSAATSDLSAALFWSGEVLVEFLPTGHGVDAAFRADTPHIAYVD